MTPFQKLGYTTDMKFKFIGNDGEFNKGEVVWLLDSHDGGTHYPTFTNGKGSAYLHLLEQDGYPADVEPVQSIKQRQKLQSVLFKLISSGILPHLNQDLVAELTAIHDAEDKGISNGATTPLVGITQEVKYTVVIKGTTFTFTQEELDDLAEELLGFTTL